MKKLVVALLISASAPVMSVGGVLGAVVSGAVGSAIGKVAGKAAMSPDINETMEKSAATINLSCPKMIDDSTRMDSASVDPGRMFTYHHTMVKLNLKDVNFQYVQGQFTNDLRARVCANKDMTLILQRGVTFAYEYKAKDGRMIGTLLVKASHCGL